MPTRTTASSATTADPRAIRAFLRRADSTWQHPPLFVVLVGDGTYDYRDIRGQGGSVVPAVLTKTPDGLFPSDNWYVDFDEDGAPDCAIGRLPAQTPGELQAIVAKLKRYDAEPDGEWSARALVVADDPDAGGDFAGAGDRLADVLSTSRDVSKIYLGERSAGDARDALLADLGSGCSLMAFVGHADMGKLCREGLLTREDAGVLANGPRLPVLVGGTCVLGMFASPGYQALSEGLVRHADGGAAAVWAPSGATTTGQSTLLLREFLQSLVMSGEHQLGPAIVNALQAGRRGGAVSWSAAPTSCWATRP